MQLSGGLITYHISTFRSWPSSAPLSPILSVRSVYKEETRSWLTLIVLKYFSNNYLFRLTLTLMVSFEELQGVFLHRFALGNSVEAGRDSTLQNGDLTMELLIVQGRGARKRIYMLIISSSQKKEWFILREGVLITKNGWSRVAPPQKKFRVSLCARQFGNLCNSGRYST